MTGDFFRSLISSLTPLEGTAVCFGLVSVYLSTRENIWSWPTAIVNVGLYSVLFFREQLYADMGLQVIYLLLSLYGWYEWLYGGENRSELRVSRITARLAMRLAGIGVVGSAVLGTLLYRTTDASLPYLDSTLSVFSLIAQWLMTRKVLENWVVWIALDVVYVWMFIFLKQLHFTAFQYAVFLALAVLGFRDWKCSFDTRRTALA
ncbi:MAG: nicotinamide riboside transporter PnuC [Gemmatimonadaceae bacterium]|nr:nicotinamide riboside transporter PnuC [Gemmatimonadaceae bacterium]